MIPLERKITEDTRLIDLTVGELKALLGNVLGGVVSDGLPPKEEEYVYGLDGICKLFGCSKTVAMRLKNGVIKKAVYQDGRRIMTDPVLARKLYKESFKIDRRGH